MKSTDYSLTIELGNGDSIMLGAEDSWYAKPAPDNASVEIDDDLLNFIKLLQATEREAEVYGE